MQCHAPGLLSQNSKIQNLILRAFSDFTQKLAPTENIHHTLFAVQVSTDKLFSHKNFSSLRPKRNNENFVNYDKYHASLAEHDVSGGLSPGCKGFPHSDNFITPCTCARGEVIGCVIVVVGTKKCHILRY